MHSSKLAKRVVLTACAALAGIACAIPGTPLGFYTVNATLTTNTCGLALGAPSPWKFNVELSETSTTLYWNAMDGSPLLTAPRGTSVTMQTTTGGNVDGVDGSLGPCNMSRTDTVALELDSATSPTSFTGTITYAFAAAAGSSCSDQLTANGGTYDVLPCTLSYTLSGAHQ